jgi:hypothetical protein
VRNDGTGKSTLKFAGNQGADKSTRAELGADFRKEIERHATEVKQILEIAGTVGMLWNPSGLQKTNL